jgi:hypothetical protein
LHPVFLAGQKLRLLKPGDGRLHAGIVCRAVPQEFVVFILPHDLARRGHDLALALHPRVQTPERLENCANLVPRQPRPGRE